MRRKLVVGNWKMQGNNAAIAKLLDDLLHLLPPLERTEVVVCPPFVYLVAVREYLNASAIKLGAQNVSAATSGAFTGEVAAAMLVDCGSEFVIVGHSERRQLFGEDDRQIAAKVAVALQHHLTPILCVGETLAEREAEKTLDIVAQQLNAALSQCGPAELRRVVVAYEPVWAIGTGRTATPAQAQAVHAFIRQWLRERDAVDVAVLYGGSVKPDNARELFAQIDIDGGLVGGASLNAHEFVAICKAAE